MQILSNNVKNVLIPAKLAINYLKMIVYHVMNQHFIEKQKTKPVFVTRFIIRGTIEERILELQDKKRRLVQGALGRHAKELRKIRLDELRLLFRD